MTEGNERERERVSEAIKNRIEREKKKYQEKGRKYQKKKKKE